MPRSSRPSRRSRPSSGLSSSGLPGARANAPEGAGGPANGLEPLFPVRIPTEEELAKMRPSVARSWRARQPPPPPADWDGICRRDMGPDVVRFLYDRMAIEEEWSVCDERGFCWWGHRLKQTVRALRPVRDGRFLLTPIVVCTDFLADVPDSPKTLECLDALNMMSVMHAWVWNRRRRRIQLLSVGVVNEETAHWQSRQLLGPVAIQCQLAHELAEPWGRLLGARPDWSGHPVRGRRRKPDEMLRIIEGCFLPAGERPSRFSAEELELTASQLRDRNLTAFANDGKLSAEFPFFGNRTAFEVILEGKRLGRPPGPVQTSLLECSRVIEHPRLGSGLFALLQTPLPIGEDIDWARRFAAHLNRRWRSRFWLYPRLGAWCVNPLRPVLAYVMFVPNLLWAPGLASWVAGNFLLASRMAGTELILYAAMDPPPQAVIDASLRTLNDGGLDS